MIRSRYTNREESWEERVATMRRDLEDQDYDRLFFILSLSLCDAYDMHDYDRHEIIKGILDGMRKHDYSAMEDGITELESIG